MSRNSILSRLRIPALAGLSLAVALVAIAVASGQSNPDSLFPLPPGKQAVIDAERAWLEEGAKVTALDLTFEEFNELLTELRGPHGTPLRLTRPPGIPAGVGEILEDFAKSDWPSFYPENLWVAQVDGQGIVIMAGSSKANAEHALVRMVVRELVDGTFTDVRNGTHGTGQNVGALRVVGADGLKLQLESKNGVEFIFNVEEGRFISPFLEPPPTLKPTPTPAPTPVPLPPVGLVSVDTSVADRSLAEATAKRSVEPCRSGSVGDRFDLDVVIDGLPSFQGKTIGIVGFQFTLVFDPARIKVTAVNPSLLLASNARSNVIDASVPGPDGNFFVIAVDGSPDLKDAAEGVGGALARLSLELLAPGISEVTIADGGVVDTRNVASSFAAIAPATIAVAQTVPSAH